MTTRSLAPRDTFEQYMTEVNRIPLLSREREEQLTTEFAASQDPAIAHELVVSNLRFVVRIANEYRGYGLKLIDLVQEGNLGLMVAVQKFDHSRGYRLISYAVWWIRAYIQAYVMRSVSMVKLGTTQSQRKLFFGRRKARAKLLREGAEPTRENMAETLGVSVADVDEMEMRLAGHDYSLDAPNGRDSDNHSMMDTLTDEEAESPESLVADAQIESVRRRAIDEAVERLDPRERMIIQARAMSEEPRTLTDLGQELGVSRERARQLEARGLGKMRQFLIERGDEALLPAT
jgi:RNA polymerase sigma-32 factor